MKIGIYGGSFNPVHFGHVSLARRAIEELSLDKLLVVPASVSPFKTGENFHSGLWDRVGRVKAAFADVEKAHVDLREIERGGVSYTIDTVSQIAEEVEKESPGSTLYYIIGEDSVSGLERWKDYSKLKTLVKFVSFPRTKESSTEIREIFSSAGVVLNPDAKIAAAVEKGVLRKNAYCPCRLQKLPEFFCPCEEFKSQLLDPSFKGFCHCRLYMKP